MRSRPAVAGDRRSLAVGGVLRGPAHVRRRPARRRARLSAPDVPARPDSVGAAGARRQDDRLLGAPGTAPLQMYSTRPREPGIAAAAVPERGRRVDFLDGRAGDRHEPAQRSAATRAPARWRARRCRAARRARSSKTCRMPTGCPTDPISSSSHVVGRHVPARVPDRQGRVRDGGLDQPLARVAGRHDASRFSITRSWATTAASVAIVDRAGKKRDDVRASTRARRASRGRRRADEVWFTGAEKACARALMAVDARGRVRRSLASPGNLISATSARTAPCCSRTTTARRGIVGLRARRDEGARSLLARLVSARHALPTTARTLLITEQGDGGGPGYRVYLRKTDGSPAVRLGSGEGMALSPDGKWVLAQRLNPSPAQLVLLPTGAGERAR